MLIEAPIQTQAPRPLFKRNVLPGFINLLNAPGPFFEQIRYVKNCGHPLFSFWSGRCRGLESNEKFSFVENCQQKWMGPLWTALKLVGVVLDTLEVQVHVAITLVVEELNYVTL